jgi:3-oxoacyl-[acyl-carrier protein] reductase
MDLGLSGKCALVTGSSRGLGFATAMQLALEGCRVAINSRNKEKLIVAARTIHGVATKDVIILPGDVTDPEIPEILIHQVVENFGGLDILVTNSGGPPTGMFSDLDDTSWQRAIDLSLMSHVRLIRAALPPLSQSKFASVLTITSLSVKQPIANLILSNSVRAATVGLTKSLALELGSQGIRFNSILPAWTETERVIDLLENRSVINGTTLEEEKLKQALESPFGRLGKPEEFARVATFLVSPAASYLTGVMLSVDGGMYKGVL